MKNTNVQLNNMVAVSEEFKGYEKQLKSLNVYLSKLDDLKSNYEITMVKKTYEKLGRKNFPRKATKEETQIIDARQYACFLTSIGFFGDRVVNGYTEAGYIPTRLICINPNNETKIERNFRFKFISK